SASSGTPSGCSPPTFLSSTTRSSARCRSCTTSSPSCPASSRWSRAASGGSTASTAALDERAILRLGEQDLQVAEGALAEGRLGETQVHLPHAHEALVEALGVHVGLAGVEALAPRAQRRRVVAADVLELVHGQVRVRAARV